MSGQASTLDVALWLAQIVAAMSLLVALAFLVTLTHSLIQNWLLTRRRRVLFALWCQARDEMTR